MARVIMRIHISGARDGQDWPPVGGSLDVSAAEADDLIRNGLAEAAPKKAEPVIERADLTPIKGKGK